MKEASHMEQDSLYCHPSRARAVASFNFLNYYVWNKESITTEHIYTKRVQ